MKKNKNRKVRSCGKMNCWSFQNTCITQMNFILFAEQKYEIKIHKIMAQIKKKKIHIIMAHIPISNSGIFQIRIEKS